MKKETKKIKKKTTKSNNHLLGQPLLIENKILTIRNQNVILDVDLAQLYGVETRVLNQAVTRNIERFPEDFMFRLTKKEKEDITNCDILETIKYFRTLPRAFTEHGALMISAVLKSETAINISIEIVRAFTKMRTMLAQSQELAKKINNIEKKLSKHDEDFKIILQIINNLILPSAANKKKVGFV